MPTCNVNKQLAVYPTVHTCLLPSLSVVDSHTNHSVLDIKVNRVKEAFRLLLVCVCENCMHCSAAAQKMQKGTKDLVGVQSTGLKNFITSLDFCPQVIF